MAKCLFSTSPSSGGKEVVSSREKVKPNWQNRETLAKGNNQVESVAERIDFYETCESASENSESDTETVLKLNVKDPSQQRSKSASKSTEKTRKSPKATNKNERKS